MNIFIALSPEESISLDKINPEKFLEIWDVLMKSRLMDSLLDDKKKCECECRLSGAMVKELTKDAIYSVMLDDIEKCIEDGKMIEKVFDPYGGEAKNTFNLVSDTRTAYRDNTELDVKSVAFYAAKMAATFMWEQMKDNYIIGLKKGND